MKNSRWFRFMLLSIVCCLACKAGSQGNPFVLMRTESGEIVAEIYSGKAPLTANNFMRYVDENRYRIASFYRVVRVDNQPKNDTKIEVIQGGIGFVESEQRFSPIAHETTEQTGILHLDGVISMARAEPGTASSEFFICIGDQPELDFGGRRNLDGQGFAAFGRVIKGMDVVRAIHKKHAEGQMLNAPVIILDVRRIEKDIAIMDSGNAGGKK